MNTKQILIGAATLFVVYSYGKSIGYLDCMKDVVDQHSDILPEGKLKLVYSGKGKCTRSITVSKPMTKES